jgi:apolipoprotein N-acyltransferase
VLPYACGLVLQQVEWSQPSGEPLRVGLVQGNVEQDMKFDPKRYGTTLEAYRRLVESSDAKLVVLPETAIPRFLDLVDPAYLDGLVDLARARSADILVGVPFRDATGRYYNGVVNLGTTGLQYYAKSHLVPLGEFVPAEFRWIVSVLKIPLSDFTRAGVQKPVQAAGERIALTVCYEDAFGEELIAQLPQATLLANVSNVAWFGDSLAPEQHLEISRMRSLETGRYMVRATNTGVTAIIDHRGRVVSQLPQFTEGVLHGTAQPRSGTTPYIGLGNAPVIAGCALACIVVLLIAIRPRRRLPPL